MSGRTMQLLDWSGRASGLEDRESFRRWVCSPVPIKCDGAYKPPCKSVPARLRGKSTTLSRLVMDPFFELTERLEIAPAEVDLVFASRFGEIQVLERLFENIFSGETVSPIDFCNSVHHTATGYTSIAAKNRRVSRTVSANAQTFGAALLETYVLLSTQKSDTVMLLLADEVVPAFFLPTDNSDFSFGLAAVFVAGDAQVDTDSAAVGEDEVRQVFHQEKTAFDWLRGVTTSLEEK